MNDMHVFWCFMEEYECLECDKRFVLSNFQWKCLKGLICKGYKICHKCVNKWVLWTAIVMKMVQLGQKCKEIE